MAMDYYDTLGVPRSAAKKEIQAAYRRLARKYHPDVASGGGKEAEERFKAINAAYEVLSDAKKRAAYDRWGDQWMHAADLERMQQQRGGPGGPFRFDLGDSAGAFRDDGGGGFGEIFERFFSGGRRQPRKGQTLEQETIVSLAEAFSGTTRTVQLQTVETCDTCGGAGNVAGVVCHACQGNGRKPAGKRLEVRIPAGVETGSRVRLAGEGAPGTGGGPPGDVVLTVIVAADPRFERRGAALHVEVPVPLTTAVLGGEIEVPTVTAKVLLQIPSGTQNGRVFRLTAKGMPFLSQQKTGDLFAKVRVVLPEHLTPEQQALFEQLQQLDAAPRPTADEAAQRSA